MGPEADLRYGRCRRSLGAEPGATRIQVDFEEWQTVSPWTEPEDWVFPSEKRTTSVWRDTLWRRYVALKLKRLGLDWVNFQVLRPTHSSLMHDLEVDPKLVADQLGHTLDVKQNVCTKAALRRRQEAVRKLDEAVPKSVLEPNGASVLGRRANL